MCVIIMFFLLSRLSRVESIKVELIRHGYAHFLEGERKELSGTSQDGLGTIWPNEAHAGRGGTPPLSQHGMTSANDQCRV